MKDSFLSGNSKSSGIPSDFEISWEAKRETKSAPINKNARKKTTKTRARLLLYQEESSAAQNYVNQITDVYNYKSETEGKCEYSDDDRKQLSDSSAKEREGAAKTITVFMKMIGRKTISVSCDTKQQMKQIKMQVTRRRKILVKMLCLVSQGKILKDENTIEDHNIKDKRNDRSIHVNTWWNEKKSRLPPAQKKKDT